MCLFPFKNRNKNSIAYKKGLTEFECGCCPECLSKRARLWALRCSAESRTNIGCMVTLTYDDYLYDKYGKKIGEIPPDGNLPLSKEHCQLFMKRLRKHFKGVKVKYLISAERGKRSNRAHYHAILFGVDFADRVKYKKSKRGNIIYTSNTLTKLWGHGICTIDCVNINAQVARYCTKYCAKDSRADDTFMLVSRGIGDEWLKQNFNGLYYTLDGRNYAIPKLIWNKYIEEKYSNFFNKQVYSVSYKYKNRDFLIAKYGQEIGLAYFKLNELERKRFRAFRDNDHKYKRYLEYWQKIGEQVKALQKPVEKRILALDDKKYFTYKQACLKILNLRSQCKIKSESENLFLPPRYLPQWRTKKAIKTIQSFGERSCHNTPNDTITNEETQTFKKNQYKRLVSYGKHAFFDKISCKIVDILPNGDFSLKGLLEYYGLNNI